MNFPISGVTASPWLLVFIGFIVGVCGGFFGVGGAFIATPALNILGFPMSYAIGTDLAHIVGKSIMATSLHRRLGNVDVKAGMIIIAGTLPGVELGARSIMALEGVGLVEPVVRWVYFFVLVAIVGFMLYEYRDYVRWRQRVGELAAETDLRVSRLIRWAHSVRLGPHVSLPVSGIPRISVWILAGVGLLTGFMAGFLGVGGGFIRVPALLYIVGMPTKVAVGTDLLEVMFSGTYGTITYALKGRVDILAALLMLGGALVGTQIGVQATRYARYRIRLYFAATMAMTAVSVFLKQIGMGRVSAYLLFASAGLMSCIIVGVLAGGILRQRRRRFLLIDGAGAKRQRSLHQPDKAAGYR